MILVENFDTEVDGTFRSTATNVGAQLRVPASGRKVDSILHLCGNNFLDSPMFNFPTESWTPQLEPSVSFLKKLKNWKYQFPLWISKTEILYVTITICIIYV